MVAYYNDNDKFACEWLEQLVDDGYIEYGAVDGRSLLEVDPADLDGFSQVHLFAGIGGWSHALRLAGWRDIPVWTGSCPCQPFSAAGAKRGESDERHLWPYFHFLLSECLPPVVFGEQTASPLGREWVSVVRSDLEALGYAVGVADLCAAGIGAPHIRQRLYFGAIRMDDAASARCETTRERTKEETRHQTRLRGLESGCGDGRLGDSYRTGSSERHKAPSTDRHRDSSIAASSKLANYEGQRRNRGKGSPESTGRTGIENCSGVDDTDSERLETRSRHETGREEPIWDGAVYVPCADGKARPIEPGLEPLVDGVSNRVGRLRGYGNAIVPQVAAVFVQSFMESVGESL